MKRLKLSICCAGAIAVLAGCSGGGDDAGAGGTPTPTATPTASPSPTSSPGPIPTPTPVDFAWIRTNVLEASCDGAACHGAESDASLLTYADVVNAPTHEGPYCDGRIRVVPGDLAASMFYQKLLDPPACGERMPLDEPPLPAETLSTIERWIMAGAPEAAP